MHTTIVKINQTIKIKNIQAKELEFWLCTTYNKIIVWFLGYVGGGFDGSGGRGRSVLFGFEDDGD